MKSTRRALISVSDKTGIENFARELITLGFEIVSTGGTMRRLADAGVAVRAVSDMTGVPEILGGRVKTLHPAVFGGILARRDLSEDMETLREHGMGEIDVVAVNLYPFEETAARPGATDADIIEQIDIGGPSLLRAAAKNFAHIYAVVDPADYPRTLEMIRDNRTAESRGFRRTLAAKVFEHCSAYDRAIAAHMGRGCEAERELSPTAAPTEVPSRLRIDFPLHQGLRYGENPHQSAGFYSDPGYHGPAVGRARQLQGKELSYNNYLDGEAALEIIREFQEPAAVILKHANPCGAGVGSGPREAFERALACDQVSAFGGIVGLNRPVDAETAEALSSLFLEVVIAPSFEPEAVAALKGKKNLRLLDVGELTPRRPLLTFRSLAGGVLVQTADTEITPRDRMTCVTETAPDADAWAALEFGWKIVRWVKSNAIVYATAERTVGIGAGQMSRIDSAHFGISKAGGDVKGACLASDGFFPFRDVVDLAAKHGIRAIIQPGGSMRDDESIAAANEHGIPMVLTGHRHFRH